MGRKYSHELSCIQQSYVCYFYYHPLLGNGNVSMCCEIFDTNINNLNVWIFKGEIIMKWLPLVKYFVVSDIIAIIPMNKRQKLNWLDRLKYDQIAKKNQSLYCLMTLG